ncbi:MAG: hypothetical protein ACK58T_46245 [Phycisphaerae bacterium]
MKTLKAIGVLAAAACAGSAFAAVDINGGSSWGGWNARGSSVSTGIWAGGSLSRSFEIYTTAFVFNGHTVSGNPTQLGYGPRGFAAGSYSQGAFQNGNLIFGLGLKMTGGQDVRGHNFVGISLGANDLRPASSLGATDGQANMRQYSRRGDFMTWFDGVSGGPSELTGFKQDGFGPNTPSSNVSNLPGGSTTYDFAFRSFQTGTTNGSVQMFFDFTAMQALYGFGGVFSGPTGWSNGAAPIGTIGSNITLSLYNDNASWTAGNVSVFGAAVPTPGALGVLCVGGVLAARRHRVANA